MHEDGALGIHVIPGAFSSGRLHATEGPFGVALSVGQRLPSVERALSAGRGLPPVAATAAGHAAACGRRADARIVTTAKIALLAAGLAVQAKATLEYKPRRTRRRPVAKHRSRVSVHKGTACATQHPEADQHQAKPIAVRGSHGPASLHGEASTKRQSAIDTTCALEPVQFDRRDNALFVVRARAEPMNQIQVAEIKEDSDLDRHAFLPTLTCSSWIFCMLLRDFYLDF